MIFTTICHNPNNGLLWSGPEIEASDWDQAHLKALAIEHWLNNMGVSTGLRVDGVLVSVLDEEGNILYDVEG